MSVEMESPPEVLQKPYDQPVERVLRTAWDRLNRRNEHFVMAIVGREGSGKSATGLKISNLLDDDFTADKVFFRLEEFLKMLRDEEFEPGAMYVLDEAGVMFGNRTWHDRAQVLANQAMQLIRDHNIGLVFTLPRLGELDSQTQGRLQAFYEIREKEPDEYVSGSWKWIDPDRTGTTGKVYKKYPRTAAGNRITTIEFTPPEDDLLEPYNERKDAYQKEVYEKAIDALSDDEESNDSANSVADIAEEIREEGVDNYVRSINNGAQRVLDKDLIQNEYGIGRRKAKRVKKSLMEDVDDDVQ